MAHGSATPTYILRGHNAPIHALLFLSSNLFLTSGDSEGWLVHWSLASKRPVGVWQAHDSGVTSIGSWGKDRLLTYVFRGLAGVKADRPDRHGRDHKLRAWQMNYGSDTTLSTILPVDGATDDQPKPWLLHSMEMSALNFCPFSTCKDKWSQAGTEEGDSGLLVASPNGLDSGAVDIFQLPTQRRVSQLPSNKSANTGMVMAVVLYYTKEANSLGLLSGYEDGQVMLHLNRGSLETSGSKWEKLMAFKAHSQPILSLSLSPNRDYFITSSADAQIAKFVIPGDSATTDTSTSPLKSINTKHAGQQGLTIRSDGKIFATAGWDSRVRVYSTKTMKELAVLKWHKEGCYSTTFADIRDDESELESVEQRNVESPEIAKRSALDVIRHERSFKAQRVHWLAAGAKDGKISLWDIY